MAQLKQYDRKGDKELPYSDFVEIIQNTKVKRPGRNSKALNYNLVIVNAPNLLLGTILGVIFRFL